MYSIPDVVIIIGQPQEMNAVRECQKLGIRSVTNLDTDCDPTLADLFVPANDDSVASLRLILNQFLESIRKGQKQFLDLRAENKHNNMSKFQNSSFEKNKGSIKKRTRASVAKGRGLEKKSQEV